MSDSIFCDFHSFFKIIFAFINYSTGKYWFSFVFVHDITVYVKTNKFIWRKAIYIWAYLYFRLRWFLKVISIPMLESAIQIHIKICATLFTAARWCAAESSPQRRICHRRRLRSDMKLFVAPFGFRWNPFGFVHTTYVSLLFTVTSPQVSLHKKTTNVQEYNEWSLVDLSAH